MVNHHPTSDLLTLFSAGSLPMSQALCISAHIEHCTECQANVSRLNSLGASFFETQTPVKTSNHLKSSVLAMLDEMPVVEQVKPAIDVNSNVPRCLQQFVPEGYDALKWKRLSPSIRTIELCTDTNGAKVELMRIKPGAKVGAHTHTGNEYTLVLEGSFSDNSGIYKKGDFVVRDSHHKHQPVVSMDNECICLAVTDAPIEFTGWMTRLLNPLIRRSYF